MDDIGYIDELHRALVTLGLPESTVYSMAFSGRGTASGEGVVATWDVDPAGSIRVLVERG